MEFPHRPSAPHMIDVGDKEKTKRTATARVEIEIPQSLLKIYQNGDFYCPKGPILQSCIVAGTQGVKQTPTLLPFCHPLPIEGCQITVNTERLLSEKIMAFECTVRTTGKTGVEMEALTGASVAALAFYDMGKSVSQGIVIKNLCLVEKRGGKSDYFLTPPLFGLILAGGKSERMGGEDKGAIVYHGPLTQVDFLFQLLSGFCHSTFVSCRQEQSDLPHLKNYPQIHDNVGGINQIEIENAAKIEGPMKAIRSALEKYREASWLVVACDLPALTEKLINDLVKARNPQKLATAFWNPLQEWPEPLCAIYEKDLFHKHHEHGQKCPRKLLLRLKDQQEIQLVELPKEKVLELRNINTREERLSYQQN